MSLNAMPSDLSEGLLLPTFAQQHGSPPQMVRSWYERPVRILILLSFLVLVADCFLVFFFEDELRGAGWDRLLDYDDSYDTPIGFTGGFMALIFVLVAVAGGRAQEQALRPCTVLLHPETLVHGVNVALLAGVVPWWLHERSARTDVDTSDLFDGWGYISGEACKLMMGLCLLPIARQSLWLNAAAAGYPEGIAFHRVTGWWCVAQVVIHTVCYTVDEILEAMSDYESWKSAAGGDRQHHDHSSNHTGAHNHTHHTPVHHTERGPTTPGGFDGTKWHAAWSAVKVFFWPWEERLNDETGKPEPNTEGVFILAGLIGTLAAIALAVFALPRVRRARYDLFYLVHLPMAGLFIVLGAVHEFEMQVYVLPGLVTYFLDRTDFLNRTATTRFHRVVGRIRVMSADWIRLDLVGDLAGMIRSEGAYGTQWTYLRVPALGSESHAFSLASRSLSIVIKGNGDWTKRLHALAVTQAREALSATATAADGAAGSDGEQLLTNVTTDLICEADGVYGNVSPPWRCFSHVLLIGGGVGITPWLPMMEEYQEERCAGGGDSATVPPAVQTMRMVFIGRDHGDLTGMGPYLPTADTTVFLTRVAKPPPADSPAASDAPSEPPSVALEDSCEVLVERRGLSGLGEGNGTASPPPVQPAQTQAPVGKSEARPWLFAFVGVVSVCLTQIAYHYIRGAVSVYTDYEKGCGEWCFEGEPTQAQYLLAKVTIVLMSFVAIAGTSIFARWASNAIASLKCPFVVAAATPESAQQRTAAIGTAAAVSTTRSPLPHQKRPPSDIPVKYGRPVISDLIDAAVAEIEAEPELTRKSAAGSGITRGLFVCVCGPEALVHSCKDAARDAKGRHRGIAIGLHAEEPDW